MDTEHYLNAHAIARRLGISLTDARRMMRAELWPMSRRVLSGHYVQGAWQVRRDHFETFHRAYMRQCAAAIREGLASEPEQKETAA